ncbi:MAG: Crp/Fnr family transcriptional regulator [Chloracidobacterium sp.]|nr:Crp/Fnr family transcriptional regulator [Chloracidobacterium sp.]
MGVEINRGVNGAGLFAQMMRASLTPAREIPPSTTLFQQGAPPREVFYIERGLVKLIHLSESGQELAIALQSQGSLPGAASVIVQLAYPFTATTVTSCALSRIPADRFLQLAKTDQQFCWRLHEIHSLEVHRQAGQLAALRYQSARQRFEKLLLQFLSAIPTHEKQTLMKIRLPLKYWEVAQLIGVRPEHLSRVLQQIKQEGILREEGGCLIVSDIRKLRSHDEDGD